MVGHKTFAWRSLSIAGARLWNELPTKVSNVTTVECFGKAFKNLPFC